MATKSKAPEQVGPSAAQRLIAVHSVAASVNVQTEIITRGKGYSEDKSHFIKATITVVSRSGTASVATAHSRVKEDLNRGDNQVISEHYAWETAETQAIGRALGVLGYGLEESIATADEIAEARSVEQGKGGLSLIKKRAAK